MICLFFPLVALAIAGFILHKKQAHIEDVKPTLGIGAGILVALAIITPLVAKASIWSQTADTEVWGGWVVQARYYEPWNEYVHRRCTRTVGSGKNQRTVTYDCSYVRYHSAQWVLDDSNGGEYNIDETTFRNLCQKFGNRSFRDLHRHYHTIDGDMYITQWEGDQSSFTKYFSKHTYVNKVQASANVFNEGEVDPKGLHPYPEFNPWEDPAVLGSYGDSSQANEVLKTYNAKFGAAKQVKLYMLLFTGEIEASLRQKALWKNGNKNEFVLCVGIKDGKINWVNHFCWSPNGHTGNDEIGLGLRQWVGKPASLTAVANDLISRMPSWKRKSFKEFEYLAVEPTSTTKWVMFALNFIGAIGIVALPFMDEITECYRTTKSYSHI